MARRVRIAGLLRREDGVTAVEFALILPLLILLTLGAIGTGMMLYAVNSLHFAVEDAARCVSVRTNICTSQAAMQAYAASRYKGPGLVSMNFALTPAAANNCGNRVVGTATLPFVTGLGTINMPLSVASCYPA